MVWINLAFNAKKVNKKWCLTQACNKHPAYSAITLSIHFLATGLVEADTTVSTKMLGEGSKRRLKEAIPMVAATKVLCLACSITNIKSLS